MKAQRDASAENCKKHNGDDEADDEKETGRPPSGSPLIIVGRDKLSIGCSSIGGNSRDVVLNVV
jgi:hypothetical protein